jgi:hypothetical protein
LHLKNEITPAMLATNHASLATSIKFHLKIINEERTGAIIHIQDDSAIYIFLSSRFAIGDGSF